MHAHNFSPNNILCVSNMNYLGNSLSVIQPHSINALPARGISKGLWYVLPEDFVWRSDELLPLLLGVSKNLSLNSGISSLSFNVV